MAETGIKIDIFRKKTLEDFTAILSDPESRLECGSAAASVAAVAAGSAFKPGITYTLATCAPGQLIGTFRSVPGNCNGFVTYDVAAGKVTCKLGGVCIIFR